MDGSSMKIAAPLMCTIFAMTGYKQLRIENGRCWQEPNEVIVSWRLEILVALLL